MTKDDYAKISQAITKINKKSEDDPRKLFKEGMTEALRCVLRMKVDKGKSLADLPNTSDYFENQGPHNYECPQCGNTISFLSVSGVSITCLECKYEGTHEQFTKE